MNPEYEHVIFSIRNRIMEISGNFPGKAEGING